jgi:DNA-binding transcriptional LysR family regulator
MICVRTAVTEVADTFAAFRRLHQNVVLEVAEPEDDAGVALALQTGRCELGVMRAALAPLDLVTVTFRREEWVAAVPRADGPTGSLTVAELGSLQFVAPPAGSRIRASFDDLFAANGAEPEIVAECENLPLMLALVQSGVGAALIPRAFAGWIEEPDVTICPIRFPQEHHLVVAHRRQPLSSAAAAYLATLADHVAAGDAA